MKVLVPLAIGCGLVGVVAIVLAIVGCVYAYRWTREWWRRTGERRRGPDRPT